MEPLMVVLLVSGAKPNFFWMLRLYKLPFYDGSFLWEVNPLTGSLLKSKHPFFKKRKLPLKVQQALFYVENPYKIKWSSSLKISKIDESKKNKIDFHSQFLFKLGNGRFLLSIFYSFFRSLGLMSTTEAFSYISTLENYQYGSENCFQRCLLVAKLSNTFKRDGVLFIGAEISTLNMHAWIIESGTQPDLADRVWINYRPLLAIVFS